MRNKTYKNNDNSSFIDNADDESTKINEQTRQFHSLDYNPIDNSLDQENIYSSPSIDKIDPSYVKKLKSKFKDTISRHAAMPNVFMSVINNTKKQKENDVLQYEKRIKLAEKKEIKLNKIMSKNIGVNVNP